MKNKLLINLLLLLILMMSAVSMLSAANSYFCSSSKYSCPTTYPGDDLTAVIPSDMVFKINGVDASKDGRYEIGFIYYDATTQIYWRPMEQEGGVPVGWFWTGEAGGGPLYPDNPDTEEIDGFPVNGTILIHVYDKTLDKFYTITSYKLREAMGNTLVTKYKSSGSYILVTLEELLVYTSPILTSPTDMAVGQPLSLDLKWDAINGASSYDVVLSQNADFSSPLIDMNQTTTTKTTPTLSNNTRYYWKVRAKFADGKITDWSTAQFLTQLPTPSITSPTTGVTNILPANASIGFSTVTGADKYELKFHPTTGSDIVVNATTSPKTVTTLSPCVQYSLTVQAMNTSTSNISPVSSAITLTTLPNSPALNAPANAANNVSVAPTFQWTRDGDCSVKYKLTVWEGANSTTTTVTSGTASTTYAWANADLKNYTTYSWTVTPVNSNNQDGVVSATRTFTTQVACASLVSPANGAKGVIPATTNLVFNQVAGAAKYTVIVKDPSNNTVDTKVVNHAAGNTTNFVTLTAANYGYSTTYSWTVTVEDVNANTRICGPWTFTTPPAAPVLKTPASGATNIALNPTMTLEHIGANYSPVTNFEVVLTKADGSAVDSKTITRTAGNTTDFTWAVTLNNFTAYKWKARSKTTDGIYSDWTAQSDFTTLVACASLVSPADGAKGVIPGTTNLVFNQVAGASKYTIIVKNPSNTVVETLPVNHVANQATNSVSMTKALYAYSTAYTWTITVEDIYANTRVCGPWSFTTPPAAPALELPANNANNVSLTPTMRLNHTGNDYSTVTGFTAILMSSDGSTIETKNMTRTAGDITNFNWTSALNNFTVYKWKARSKTAEGILSDWSSESTFTTEIKCGAIVDPVDGKHGFKPAANSFIFYQVEGGAKYTISIKDPSNTVVETKSVNQINGQLTNSIQMANSYNYATTYTWTITIEDIYANTKVCGPYTFDTPPAAPTLNLPANNAINVALIPTFEVGHAGANYTGVTKFEVEVRNVPDAIEVTEFEVTKNSSGNTTTFTISPATDLKAFTSFKWKARSINSFGIYSDWSAESTFETEVACPSPVKPTNNQKFVLIGSDIQWSSVTGASTYQLLVSKNSNMSSPFINSTQAGTTYNPATDFEFRTNYYWTVKVTDTHGNSKTCGPWTFETELDAPRLSSPANNATCIPVQDATGFQWQTYSGATKYDLQYSKVDNDWAHATTVSNLTNTHYAFSGLDRKATYYWRVQAWIGSVSTGYCGAFTFTTIDIPVVLNSPADGACGLNTSTNFTWNAVSGTTNYTINVTTDPTFGTIDFTETPATNNVTINGLEKGKEYYWRVTSDKCGSHDLTEAEILTFRVIPDEPSLVSPADDAVDVSSWGDLQITGTLGADGYQIYISDAADFSTVAYEYSGSDLTPPYSGLNSNTHYYWKARAFQNCSGTEQYGEWSDVFEFDTKLLGPPQIKSPEDGLTDVFLDVDLEWYTVPTVSYYALQVSTDPTFTDADDQVVNEAKVFGLKYSLKGLDYGTTYYWRLRSVIAEEGVYEESGWSKAYTFTTIPAIDIEGPEEVCVGIDNIKDYTLHKIAGITYTWGVIGGTFEDDGNATDNQVRVIWNTVGTGKLIVIRSGSVWGNFTDTDTLDVNVKAVAKIDITAETDTYYENKFCANEKIVFTATINNPNITEGDLQEYYWDFGNGNIVSNKLTTKFSWPNPGTYTAKFYARTDADGCADYTKTMTIVVAGDCPVTALLVSDNNICNGAASALFETYVFGGAGGSLATDYKYAWAPKASFQNPTQKDGIYLSTTSSKYIDFYAYDKNNKTGHLNFKVLLRAKPAPKLASVITVPTSISVIDLENGVDGKYKLLQDYGCYGNCDGWSWIWKNENYVEFTDINDHALKYGINTFYLTVTNNVGCNSNLNRGIIYRARSKEILDHELTLGSNASAVLSAYPNPVISYLNVFAEFDKEANITCSIINLEGKIVKSFNTFGKIYESTIDVNDLQAGSYILSVETINDAVVWKFNKN